MAPREQGAQSLTLRVLLDCDGVLADFITPALGIVRDLCDRELVHDDVVDYDLGQLVPEHLRAEFWRRTAELGFCLSLRPYEGALQAFGELQAAGHTVEIVTAPMRGSATWASERREWLNWYFGIPAKRVHSTHDKADVPGDLFLDDNPTHVRVWKAANPHGVALVWQRLYNIAEPVRGGERLHYARHWPDVFYALEQIQERGQRKAVGG